MMDSYVSPLNTRYSSPEMSYLFSQRKKFTSFRRLWLALAEAEAELGLPISQDQLDQMRDHLDDIDFERAREWEKITRHDVMAHVKTFGEAAPKAAPIIHLGATSCYVGDNTDLLIMREAFEIIEKKLALLLKNLGDFALKYKDLACLGYTHLQPAQLVTVGKRAALWSYDFLMDLEAIIDQKNKIRLRGAKGTTGTQASFLELFNGDYEKVKKLDQLICEKMGMEASYYICSQTYSRKVDAQCLQVLAGLASSMHKMTNDLRILQSLKEIEEPFEKNQIGSSAMAYKRNPMRSERIASLAKFVLSLEQTPLLNHSTQWMERTLDDSANKRMAIPEAFLGVDAMLELAINVTGGLVVYEKTIEKHLWAELPFMATENILMEGVKKGGNRQDLHEAIRVHSQKAAYEVKMNGKENDLLDRLAQDPLFSLNSDEIRDLMDPSLYTGCAPFQVEEFVEGVLWPSIERYDLESLQVQGPSV